MYKYLSVFFILFFGNYVIAQEPDTKVQKDFPVIDLRTSLLSWLDADGGIMLGVNVRTSEQFSFALEPSYLFYDVYRDVEGDERSSPSGYKLRADVRYYLTKRDPDSRQFLSAGLHFKRVNRKDETTFGINCLGGQCDYFQEAWYTNEKTETGVFVLWGSRSPSLFNNENWELEFFLGIGVKQISFKEKDIPLNGSFLTQNENWLFPRNDQGKLVLPMMPIGLKLVYILP